jgi:hypothetical protein
MFNRLKLVALLLVILPAPVWSQTAPENTNANGADQTVTPAVSTEAAETSVKPLAGMTVEYGDRLLRISVRQARLGDLLAAIGEKTGVMFDLPDALADRLVTAESGPAALRDALTTLLKKLEVGYGLSGDPAEPDTVERVVLTGPSDAASPAGGDNANVAVTATPDALSDDGMTPFEVEEVLAQKAVEQNRIIEKNLTDAEAERQAQIAREDFGGKPPEPGKTAAPAGKRPRKNPAPPQPQ